MEEIKLFGKWSFEGIQIQDPGLKQYISVKPVYVPHSMGRHEHGKFHKAKVNIVERLINNLMRPGSTAGKKTRAINLVKNALEMINIRTGENPIQVLVDAITNTAPREETTRIAMGGISYASAVDIAPQRRVDLAIKYLVQAIAGRGGSSLNAFEENFAQELIMAAKNSQESRAVKRKDEIERIAVSAR